MGILRVQRLRKSIKDSQRLLSDLFPDLKLGWEPDAYRRLGEVAQWFLDLHAEVEAGTVDGGIHDMLDRELDGAKLEKAAADCQASEDALSSALGDVAAVLNWRAERSVLDDDAFSVLKNWLSSAHEQVDSLFQIVRFNQAEERVVQLGLGDVMEVAASWENAGEHLVELFDRACFSAWMEAAFCEHRVLNEFDGRHSREDHRQVPPTRRGSVPAQ